MSDVIPKAECPYPGTDYVRQWCEAGGENSPDEIRGYLRALSPGKLASIIHDAWLIKRPFTLAQLKEQARAYYAAMLPELTDAH